MAKRCELTGTGVQSGNNVSHSHRKTRRRFLPNLQNVSLHSNALESTVSLKITVATMRSVDHNGGLDDFLLSTANTKLTETGQKLKKKIKKALEKKGNAGKKTSSKQAKKSSLEGDSSKNSQEEAVA